MARHFLAPPLDEVHLRQSVITTGGIRSLDELGDYQARWGVDRASMALLLHLEAIHTDFIKAVNAEAAAPWPGDCGATLLVVPALYYRERPDLGGDGELVLNAARACGFEARRVPTDSLGTVQGNARILAGELERCGDRAVLVASLSIGALQVRHLLSGMEPGRRPPFKGWLNLGGTPYGAHAIERVLNTRTRRMAGRILARMQGLPFAAVEESLPSHPLWLRPFPDLAGIQTVTVLPIPLEAHVQKPLQSRFQELKERGPTDGMVLLAESIPPGQVYPLLGADHLLRTAAAAEAMYRILRWFRKELGPSSEPV